MGYVLMTVVDEAGQTLSGPLPVVEPPRVGDIIHGFGRIISIQTQADKPRRIIAKVETCPHVYYTVSQLVFSTDQTGVLAILDVPLCYN